MINTKSSIVTVFVTVSLFSLLARGICLITGYRVHKQDFAKQVISTVKQINIWMG